MTLQSTHAQLQADHDHARSRLATADEANAQYVLALQQMQTTLLAANAKSDDMHDLWSSSKSELDAQKEENVRLAREIESRTSDSATATARIEELGRILKTTKEENEALRALTAGSMAELVASTRSVQSVDVGSNELQQSKSRAIEEEVNGLRSLHQQSVSRLEASGSELAALKSRNVELERHLISARSEVDVLRARHASALQDAGRVKAQIAARDLDLRNKARAAEAAELKAGLLRSLMAENGLTVDDDFANRSLESIMSNTDSPEQLARRVQELESRLEQRTRAHRELEGTHDDTVRELRSTEDRFREASRKHEAAADEISSLVQEVQRLRSGGAASVTLSSEANGQAEEDLAALQERHRALESTHLKAVQYVKGTEKMLRRMKDELSKYRERNEQLEAELAERDEEGPSGSGELRDQLDQLRSQVDELRASSQKAHAENEGLQKHIVSLESDYTARVDQHQAEATERYKAYEAEVDRLATAHAHAQTELDAAAERNRALSEQVGRRESEPAEHDSKELETSLIQAQKLAERRKQENAELEARCKDAEAKISLLLEHIDNTTSQSSHEKSFDVDRWNDSRRISSALDSVDSASVEARAGPDAKLEAETGASHQ